METLMAGHKVGDSFTVVVPAADAYGEHDGEDPEVVPLADMPEDIEEGMPIVAELDDGTEVELWILEVGEETVLLSQNHPLAGVDLTFDVDIKSIRAASEEELLHGHPHGVDGDEGH